MGATAAAVKRRESAASGARACPRPSLTYGRGDHGISNQYSHVRRRRLTESLRVLSSRLGVPHHADSRRWHRFLPDWWDVPRSLPTRKVSRDIAPNFPKISSGFPGITLAHNTRTKGEVADVLQLAEHNGGKLEKHAQLASWRGYSGYFSDLDGYLREVAWADFWQFNDDGSLLIT